MDGVVVEKILASDNLNDCVDSILNKQKVEMTHVKQVIRHNSNAKNKEKRKRQRKDKEQHYILLGKF